MKLTNRSRIAALAAGATTAALCAALLAAPTPAAAADPSAPSAMSVEASGILVAGSLLSLQMAGNAVVASAELSGDGMLLVLDAGGKASAATVRVSASAARGLSIGAGTVLQVVTLSTGQMLVLSGRVLAFIPNAVGNALLHHARVS